MTNKVMFGIALLDSLGDKLVTDKLGHQTNMSALGSV